MKPGRELDALIAEKVMGLEPWPEQNPNWQCKAFKAKFVAHYQEPKPCLPPNYSTNILDAWKVVKNILSRNKKFQFSLEQDLNTWTASFGFFGNTVMYAESAPHAICLAALKAVE